MSKNVILSVEGLAKMYRLGQIGTGTLSHDLNRWVRKLIGKEDQYISVAEKSRQDLFLKKDNNFWALKDINFQVCQGDAFAVIGGNGAGKSTLLKILSQITFPTLGKFRYNGRIASLLEVGTGFHPELTGRENIYLNGSLLGMKKNEIDNKLDEIIDFSGIERHIDTPVKRYSSGMAVRLGFSVAAHLEPEILIVDEVLAVGDADFQNRCISKMNDIKCSGRTILFVSHNMNSVLSLCNTGIVLEKGAIISNGGSISDLVSSYVSTRDLKVFSGNLLQSAQEGLGEIRIISVELQSSGDLKPRIKSGERLTFILSLQNNLASAVEVDVRLIIVSESDIPITLAHNRESDNVIWLKPGSNVISLESCDLRFAQGMYRVDISVRLNSILQCRVKGIVQFQVLQSIGHEEINYLGFQWFKGLYTSWNWKVNS